MATEIARYLEITVTSLAYAGMILTLLSSAWGLFRKAPTEIVDGKTTLTRHGWISLSFIIVGSTIAIFSSVLKASLDATKGAERALREREQALRLAVSAQPLQSLRMVWEFNVSEVDTSDLRKAMNDVDQMLSDSDDDFKYLPHIDRSIQQQGNYRAAVFYPWLARLAGGTANPPQGVILRIPLQESEAFVIPIGVFSNAECGSMNSPDEIERCRNMASGIDSLEITNHPPADDWKDLHKERARWPGILGMFSIEDKILRCEIEISEKFVGSSIDRIAADIKPLSLLPDGISVTILTDVKHPVWSFDNFSGRMSSAFEKKIEYVPERTPIGTLSITPNNIDVLSTKYEIFLTARGTIGEAAGPEQSPDQFATFADLQMVRLR